MKFNCLLQNKSAELCNVNVHNSALFLWKEKILLAPVAFPSENQECFFSGLRMIFEQMGGVPQSIRIDNLSAAVVQIRSSNQETIYTDAFLQ